MRRVILNCMAKQESNREDLLREATALVERIELATGTGGGSRSVVLGFRSNGALSVYFSADLAYHFNSQGELRRAFVGGRLIKAEQGTLVALERVRREAEVQLLRQPLEKEQQASFMAVMQEELRWLRQFGAGGLLTVVGQVPADANVLGRTLDWVTRHAEIQVAESPHAT